MRPKQKNKIYEIHYYMETATTTRRKRASIYIKPYLMDRLRERAHKQRISLSNYVETLLLDSVYNEPNETTLAAMRECESGVELPIVDTSSMEAFKRSMGLYEKE